MKKVIGSLIVILCIVFYFVAKANGTKVEKTFALIEKKIKDTSKEGDIIFQTSESKQCEAVRIATNSKYSHCGIIYTIDGEKFVYEAVQPVKITPLKEWISHGKDNKFIIKRLKNSEKILNSATLEKMKSYGKQFKNKNYDLYFEWTDDNIYCSELVWKIYKNGAGIELCKLESLKNFNLEDKKVKEILKERYGSKIPYDEQVVAPSQIVESKLLETVIDTY